MKRGDLVKIKPSNPWAIERYKGRTAIYLGMQKIQRDDGLIIGNYKFLFQGDQHPTIFDKSFLHCVEVIK
tara:strand:+ start:78 stop:287 length:210 start_codon:yes stop_codon:yes gene_type:complete